MKCEIISFLAKTTTIFMCRKLKDFGVSQARLSVFFAVKQLNVCVFPCVSVAKKVVRLKGVMFFLGCLLILPMQVEAFELFSNGSSITAAPPEQPTEPPAPSPEIINQRQADKFQAGIKEIARQLFTHLDEQDPVVGDLADGLAFTVFTDLKKLRRTSSFGRYLSEQLMTEFQQRGYRVFEVRKSQNILVQEKRGEYGLSRASAEVESSIPARTLLTGTYSIARGTIMVNAKILDNKDAVMLSSATVFFEKNAMTEGLLADSASAHPKITERMYMKKLEL